MPAYIELNGASGDNMTSEEWCLQGCYAVWLL
jgi:hypothetical protein